MTTCSSSSDNPESTSVSDVEDYIDQCATDEILPGHLQEGDELGSTLEIADDNCDEDELNSVSLVTHSSISTQQAVDAEPGCNGRVLVKDDIKSEVTCNLSNKLQESVITCPANGLVSEMPLLSSAKDCLTSSELQNLSHTKTNSENTDSLVESTVHCTSHTVNSESKSSLISSVPLLSIPNSDHTHSSENSFSVLPSSSPTADPGARVTPHSVFSVPCVGEESDCFTDVNLNDDTELSGTVTASTLSVPPTVSSDDSSCRPQIGSSSSNIELDDAIVQSVLRDDDDDNHDSSHAVGASRHSATIAFSTNTGSAAFRTPAHAATDAVTTDNEGLHVVEPDSASFEEISLQSSSASVEFRNVSPEQTVPSGPKRTSLASFLAR